MMGELSVISNMDEAFNQILYLSDQMGFNKLRQYIEIIYKKEKVSLYDIKNIEKITFEIMKSEYLVKTFNDINSWNFILNQFNHYNLKKSINLKIRNIDTYSEDASLIDENLANLLEIYQDPFLKEERKIRSYLLILAFILLKEYSDKIKDSTFNELYRFGSYNNFLQEEAFQEYLKHEKLFKNIREKMVSEVAYYRGLLAHGWFINTDNMITIFCDKNKGEKIVLSYQKFWELYSCATTKLNFLHLLFAFGMFYGKKIRQWMKNDPNVKREFDINKDRKDRKYNIDFHLPENIHDLIE